MTPIYDSDFDDEFMFCSCHDGSIRQIDLESLKENLKLSTGEKIKCLSIFVSIVDKNTLYAGYSDGSIKRWNKRKSAYIMAQQMKFKQDVNVWTIKESVADS